MSDLGQLLNFINLTHQFQQVKRAIYVKGEDRNENDSEHSYQLAITAWYLIQSQNLDLDLNLSLKYALVHDLVEVYAGDTYIYDKKGATTKHTREKAAAQKLNSTFPEFKDLHQLIEGYEQRSDPESKFIYALDKILPVINIYLNSGSDWKRQNVSLPMLMANKTKKVAESKIIDEYFKQLLEVLKKQEHTLFPQAKGN